MIENVNNTGHFAREVVVSMRERKGIENERLIFQIELRFR